MNLQEITNNLILTVDRYASISLIETKELSMILRDLGVNLSYLVQKRKEYYNLYQNIYHNSKETTQAGKHKESEKQVPELDEIRKILRHYSELQRDIRTQISLWKNND